MKNHSERIPCIGGEGCRDHSKAGWRLSCAACHHGCPFQRTRLTSAFLLRLLVCYASPSCFSSPELSAEPHCCVSRPCSMPLPPSDTVCASALSVECPGLWPTNNGVWRVKLAVTLKAPAAPLYLLLLWGGGSFPGEKETGNTPKSWGRHDQGWHERQRVGFV